MLSHEEKQYLTWLTAEKFEGWGAVVDLGPWLGSSSAALAEGLKRQGKNVKISSVDIFRWEPNYMDAIAPEGLKEGDDFLPLFMREIGDYAGWVDARKQDLMQYSWNGGPIEIFFVDAAKTWELTNAIFRGFGHYLMPGRSRVVLQDFRYHETHWLPLIFDSRPDLWQEVESVDDGCTVTFVPLKPLDGPAGIHTDYSEEAFPLESAERLLRNRIASATPANRPLFLRALYRKYLIDGPLEGIQKLRAEVVAEELSSHVRTSIENVESILVPRGWKAYDRGDYETSRILAERCLTATEKRSVYALTLLGFSLLRLGDRERAKPPMEEVLRCLPTFPAARLFRAELALTEGRYLDAETEARDVLKSNQGDETTIDYSLNVLSQAWNLQGSTESHVQALIELVDSLNQSPSFLACLAREQSKLGQKDEAARNVEKALLLSPGHRLALELRAEWKALDNVGSRNIDGLRKESVILDSVPAGRLNKALIPDRPAGLRDTSLPKLTSELLARVNEGSFSVSEETILLGSEIHEAMRVVLEVHNNRLSGRRYRDLFGAFYEFVGPPRPCLDDATIVELGCGSINPYGFLFLFLMLGARRGMAIDLDQIQDVPKAVRALSDLAAKMLIHPQEIVGDYPITREQILRNVASFDLARLHAGDLTGLDSERLIFKQESVQALTLPDGEIDFMISNAFFEHIPRVDDAIAEIARTMRKGGIGVHTIDGSDHRRYGDPSRHPLDFLTENDDGPLVHGSNRIRPVEFASLFKRHGFEVVSFIPFETVEVTPELRERFVEPFRSMKDEALAEPIAKLVVRRL